MDWKNLTRELYKACLEKDQTAAKTLWLEALRKNIEEKNAGQHNSQSYAIR